MNWLVSRRSLMTSLVSVLATRALPAEADEVGAGSDLVDDFSRGEIFERFVVVPAKKLEGPQSLAIPSIFKFPDDVLHDCKVGTDQVCRTDYSTQRSKPMMFGVDINHYTKDGFSFNQLREQQVRFVQMKASQGDSFKDKKFQEFWKKAGSLKDSAKIYRGPYHFLTASAEGKKQADWFLKILDKAGGLGPSDMAPGVDLEWDVYKSTGDLDHWKGKGAQYIIDNAIACLERIKEKTGKTPVLYTGKSWFGPNTVPLDRFNEFAAYPLWVFDYDPKRKVEEKPLLPDKNVAASLWQYTAAARIPATFGGKVDASVFYGTEADFEKVFQIT